METNQIIWDNRDKSNEEISQILKQKGIAMNKDMVRGRKNRMKHAGRVIAKPTIEERPLEQVIQEKQSDRTKKRDKKALTEAVEKLALLEAEREALFAIKKTPQTFSYASRGTKASEGVAFMVASDWHVEERVDPLTINGMNEYSPDIAKQRAEKFFTNGLRLVHIFQKDLAINKVVIPLLGDFFSNTIHEELQENNAMMPGHAAWYAQSLIKSGIDYILKNSRVDIQLVCHTGNHGRMTKKVHIATEAGNSLEQYMYRNLAELYSKEKRVSFLIADGMMSYVDVFDFKVRLLHGHSIKFGGGVGGITIPVRKAIAQWDRVMSADLTVLGHFHQCMDGGNFIVNGSLIGYNTFAQFIKADYEPPKQQFFLITNYRGGEKSVVAPIRLE